MSSVVNKVSFTIRRPSPVSRASSTGADPEFKVPALPRHLNGSGTGSGTASPLGRASPKPKSRTYEQRDSSSDEDEGAEDELVTGFDQFGVQRVHEKPKPQGPLVIPALKNKDWRDQARKRRQLFVPPSAAAATGADGSVGGLGTRDSINSGPQLVGLQVHERVKVEDDEHAMQVEVEGEQDAVVAAVAEPVKEESEDQRALRLLLENARNGDDAADADGPQIDIIPALPVSEEDAYKQDVAELPDSASLADYERVPVSQFGAALLRGMGWKEGTGASRSGKGPVQPYLPQARPALLGIGAKEQEVLDDGSKKRKKGRPERKYVPLVKKERERERREGEGEGEGSKSASGSSSRRRTPDRERGSSSRRSPSPDRERRRDSDRHHDNRDRERRRDDRDRDREHRDDRRERSHREYDSGSGSGTGSRRDSERDRRRERSSDRSERERDRRDR